MKDKERPRYCYQPEKIRRHAMETSRLDTETEKDVNGKTVKFK